MFNVKWEKNIQNCILVFHKYSLFTFIKNDAFDSFSFSCSFSVCAVFLLVAAAAAAVVFIKKYSIFHQNADTPKGEKYVQKEKERF